jgi:hypothetical protein
MTRLVAAGLVLAAVVVGAVLAWPGPDQAVVAIETARTYQTMKGWEVSAHLWEQNKQENRYDGSWLAYREELLSRLVNELGVDRVRIEIRSGAENRIDYWTAFQRGTLSYSQAKQHRYEIVNDNDDPEVADPAGFQFAELDYRVQNVVLPMKRLVEANGERLYVNLIYVDFAKYTRLKGTLSHARNPEEYAELVLAAFQHLQRTYALVPDALEVVLEPDNSDDWRGGEIGRAMVAAARRLRRAGFTPEFIAPSTARAYAASPYIDAMMQVPGVAGLVTAFAYHRYDTQVTPQSLAAIRERARRYGVETAMLEHLAGGAPELHADLADVDVGAWQQYGIAYRDLTDRDDKGGYLYLVDPERRRVRMSSRTPALAQYFKFIRAGAVRLEATSNRGDRKAVAFRNRSGSHVVVVRLDGAGGPVSVTGLPSGRYGIRYTTESEVGRELPRVDHEAGRPLRATVPAPGVVSFYQVPRA